MHEINIVGAFLLWIGLVGICLQEFYFWIPAKASCNKELITNEINIAVEKKE